MYKYIPASDYTVYCFDRYGEKPYRAILETVARDSNGCPFDLTILKQDSFYLAAHGSIIHTEKFKTIQKAKDWLNDWFISFTK